MLKSQRAQPITDNKLRGMGGHMTAAYIHEITFLDHAIERCTANELFSTAASLRASRAKLVNRMRKALHDRGYWGAVPGIPESYGYANENGSRKHQNGKKPTNGHKNGKGAANGYHRQPAPAVHPVLGG